MDQAVSAQQFFCFPCMTTRTSLPHQIISSTDSLPAALFRASLEQIIKSCCDLQSTTISEPDRERLFQQCYTKLIADPPCEHTLDSAHSALRSVTSYPAALAQLGPHQSLTAPELMA